MSGRDGGRDGPSLTLILTALPEETSALLDRLRNVSAIPRASGRAWSGRLAGQPVLLGETGVGPQRAAAGMAKLLRFAGPRRWIGLGLAGALAPELSAGEILIASSVSDGEGVVTPGPDPAWAARASACGAPAKNARFLAAARIASTPSEKGRLRGRGAEQFDALDMESAAWARAAAAAGHDVPYLLVRVVSDTAEEELPELVAAAIGPDGSLDRGRIARRALRHPGSIGKLLLLRRRARSCAGSLAEFLETFAAAGF
ncbi:MAG: hypothetical protein ABJC07_07920 [Acidobacteriota bacterium]